MKLRMGAGLLGSSRMTPIERQQGRFLRAPDHPSGGEDDGFEIGAGFAEQPDEPETPAEPEPKGKKPAGKPKPAAEEAGGGTGGDEGTDEKTDDEPDEGEENEEEKPKKRPSKQPSQRIRELNKALRESERARDADRMAFEQRFADLEKRLPGSNGGDTNTDERAAPDPNDTEKYPLGVLDEKYVEDKIDWMTDKKTSAAITAALQRQEQADQATAAEQVLTELRTKADDLASKGSELHEDYEEIVVEAGLKGDYPLTQVTFEAAAEAENGAQILYDLANDKTEAARVAKLSPFAQLRYVMEKDSEISGKAPKPRTVPGATPPPANNPRGSNSKTVIRDDTDNLDDFEKKFYKK